MFNFAIVANPMVAFLFYGQREIQIKNTYKKWRRGNR